MTIAIPTEMLSISQSYSSSNSLSQSTELYMELTTHGVTRFWRHVQTLITPQHSTHTNKLDIYLQLNSADERYDALNIEPAY